MSEPAATYTARPGQVVINVCPFCGRYDARPYSHGQWFYVACSCGANGPHKEIEAEAIRLWNDRPAVRGRFTFPEIPK